MDNLLDHQALLFGKWLISLVYCDCIENMEEVEYGIFHDFLGSWENFVVEVFDKVISVRLGQKSQKLKKKYFSCTFVTQ